ncbi:MAG: hypothetical protein IID43_00295, partial [Planctomycetes bacterium]|nr:hypothetical protein [Planctomycetota bacterium]
PDWLGAYAKVFDDPTVAAASGIVLSPPPKTWAERAYFGTAGLGGSRYRQRRMAGGNMALRRELATRYPFDEALTYYCDDDEIAWRLQADGHRIAFVTEAVVHHIHPLTLRTYLGQGYRQGRGSARFWYKRGIYIGRDMWAMVAALLTAPLAALGDRWWLVPLFFVLLQIAAIAGNEKLLKGKGWLETLRVLPLCVLYYVYKFCGVLRTMFGLLLGREREIRESKRRWLAR